MRWPIIVLNLLKKSVLGHSKIVYAIWVTLIVTIIASLVTGRWFLAYVTSRTLVFSLIPAVLSQRFEIKLPVGFITFVVMFIFGTTFLGEEFDFYELFWWWDILLHGSSAIGFALIGAILVFMIFQGDRYVVPPFAAAFIALCFAVTVGSFWEIYEFAMDQLFGYNMQKSGLLDTMSDSIVNAIGASLGATAGYFYLKGREFGGLAGMIAEFVRMNRWLFKKEPPKDN